MTAKTKKLIAGTLIAVPMLAVSILTPIACVKQANAEYIDNQSVITEKSYFAEFGLTVSFAFEDYEYHFYEYSQPFFPYLFTAVPAGYQEYLGDGTLNTMFEDYPGASANNIIQYQCGYQEPSYDNDGGVIDDGIYTVYATQQFDYYDGELVYERATISVHNQFLNFEDLSENLSYLQIPYYTKAMLYYSCFEPTSTGWQESSYSTNITSDNGVLRFTDLSNTPHIRGFGFYTEFRIVFDYDTYRPSNHMVFYYEGNPNIYTLPIGYNIPTMTEYMNEFNLVVDSPTVDDTLYGMVTGFLETEFLPNFTFGDLLLLGMGITLFFMFLKIFAGG